ncbi:hypothetical protein CAPTEDRAFT_40400, partial [Capitella teleta]
EYICGSPYSKKGTRLEDMKLSPEECIGRPLPTAFWVTLSVCLLQFNAVRVVSLAYRFRWHLQLYFFYFSAWLRPTPPRRSHSNFTFDLFVSHNSNDATWVKNVLVPELEKRSQSPFKVCVYSRNWLTGRNIDDRM